MPNKDKLTDYSATNASNTDVGGVNIDEGMLPSSVNNAIREVLTHLKNFAAGTDGIDVLSLADDDASAAMKIQAPASVTADTTLTLPDGDGSDGQALVTDGSGTLSWADLHSARNMATNGAMTINQRGDTTGQANSGYYSVDRYRMLISGLGAWNISQSTSAPDGFAYSKRWYCHTADASPAANDYLIVEHRLEGQDLQHLDWGSSNAKKITLSFWVKSSETGTYIVEMSHAGATLPYSALQYTIDTADTWEYKTLTFSGDTSDSTVNSNAVGLYINWWLGAGTTFTSGTYNADTWHVTAANRAAGLNVNMADTVGNNWQITGVQLTVGDVDLPFIHESYGETLAKCQRYYYRIQEGNTYQRFGTGQNSDTSRCRMTPIFPVEMRATPSLDQTGTASNYAVYAAGNVATCTAVPTLSSTQSTSNIAEVIFQTNSLTVGQGGACIANNNTSVYLAYNAEL